MQKKSKTGSVLLAAAAILGMWLGTGVSAASDDEAAKNKSSVMFDGAAFNSIGVNAEPVVVAQAGSGAAQPEFSGLAAKTRVDVPTPTAHANKGGGGRGGWRKITGTVLAGMTILIVLVGCAQKPPSEITPAKACDIQTKAVQDLGKGTNKAQLAAENAKTFAETTWSAGDMKSTSVTNWVRKYDPYTGEWVTVLETTTIPSRFDQQQQSIQGRVSDAEGAVRSAGEKLSKATVYSAKCGPKAQEAMTAARSAIEKARQAVADAKEAITAGPNTQQAKDAANRAVELAKEAYSLTTQAEMLVAEAAANVVA